MKKPKPWDNEGDGSEKSMERDWDRLKAETRKYKMGAPGQIIHGQFVTVKDAAGEDYNEPKLPVGHVVELTQDEFDKYMERGLVLHEVTGTEGNQDQPVS